MEMNLKHMMLVLAALMVASGAQAMQLLLHWLDSSQPIERLGD